MRRIHVMWLDKFRVFRLTPESMAREWELEAVTDNDAQLQLPQVSKAAWLFLIHEDPTLTVAAVDGILAKYLKEDRLGFRKWQVRRLRKILADMLLAYQKEKRHV